MHMRDANFAEAYNEFYEGFRAYQEAGNARAKDCLKYVVLANMLALSDINPFAAREAKVYQEHKEIMASVRASPWPPPFTTPPLKKNRPIDWDDGVAPFLRR